MKKYFKKIIVAIFTMLIFGFLIPQSLKMPVKGATKASYSQDSYWFYPWGKSVTHKGVDIFAKKNTPIYSSTIGIVLFTGNISLGGNVVYVLGPKWRLHYYAHLDQIKTSTFCFVSTKTEIGTVGTTGNAVGKSPHLHYAIKTIIPYLWRIDNGIQGWKKMFFLNPIEYINDYYDNQ